MKAVIYARYSSESQREESIEGQLRECREYAEKNNLPYRAGMTSNGSLFNEDLAEKAAKDWKVSSIQITLDGTEEYYNEAKAYVDGSDFNKVVNNIKLLTSKGIFVSIRLNYDSHNYDNIKE